VKGTLIILALALAALAMALNWLPILLRMSLEQQQRLMLQVLFVQLAAIFVVLLAAYLKLK
jgi:hypothetical protein